MTEISLFFGIRVTINYNAHVLPHFHDEYNDTLSWDLEGTYDETKCLDLDPFNIYENSPEAEEPEFLFSVKP
ncbi:hypothetical protein [uncultured Clostridium sp.]|uniref:hypothetical protein n=1 Tax=uncultured Clostridium sp. TaxID=59620 RepID=UPI0028EF2EF8|nr:hypothetical protein [uncultured Clostridium sp.]